MKKNDCTDPEKCVTQMLADAGHDDLALKVFIAKASEFISKDWPAWQEEVRGQIAATDEKLTQHIKSEDSLFGAYSELSKSHSDLSGIVERHNKEAVEKWIPIIEQFDQHRADMLSLLGVANRAEQFLDVMCTLAKWTRRAVVFGGGTVIGLAALIEAAKKLGWL